ncbi:MAG: hypothetical protein K2Y23_22070 [Cyanobacteria bacterium]|nr:hypothetical protein [Cyanobacteriota bacterium]
MTDAERVQIVVEYGFTERQARFLVLVMRHSGLCVKRQYATFAGIANGEEKCNAFFDKLVRREFAVTADCIHNRARLYHVQHRALYHAIGEADGRYRRAVPARSAAQRLMRLDAALTAPDLDWLATRSEKMAWLQTMTTSESSEHPNQFPGTFPIGMDATGHVVILYLATAPWTDDFRTFLIGHTALLQMASSWTLRIVFPQSLRRFVDAYQAVIREELESPLQAATIHDLKRYFFHRRRGTDLSTIPEALRAFLKRCADVFGGPRFTHLYRRWLTEDEAALEPIPIVIPEALASGRAHVECTVLPHAYEHLSPLVSRRRARRRRPRIGEQRGDAAPHSVNPLLNPAP